MYSLNTDIVSSKIYAINVNSHLFILLIFIQSSVVIKANVNTSQTLF